MPAFAQNDDPPNWCQGGIQSMDLDDVRFAKATAARVYFFGSEKQCPDGDNCRLKTYVVKNDPVVIWKTYNGFGCATFTPRKGASTDGWISLKDLEISERSTPSLKDWVGNWETRYSSLELRPAKSQGKLKLTGDAVWYGAKGTGSVHVGQIEEEEVSPNGDTITYHDGTGEYACKAKIRYVAPYLVVSDSGYCGGINVTFTGVYERAPAGKRRKR